MAGFFQKINTLLRAQLDSFLEEDVHRPAAGDRATLLSADRLGKDVDAEIKALRQRIDEALNYEEDLQEQIDALRQEASDWDLQADNALLNGEEATARHALNQMKTTEQRAKMLEADLAEHRYTTAEFIDRVNVLEGLIAEARHDAAAETATPAAQTLETVLHTAQREADQPEGTAVHVVVNPASTTPPASTDPSTSSHDDLAARRARLARRSPEQEE
jgi:phage shock protein A